VHFDCWYLSYIGSTAFRHPPPPPPEKPPPLSLKEAENPRATSCWPLSDLRGDRILSGLKAMWAACLRQPSHFRHRSAYLGRGANVGAPFGLATSDDAGGSHFWPPSMVAHIGVCAVALADWQKQCRGTFVFGASDPRHQVPRNNVILLWSCCAGWFFLSDFWTWNRTP